MTCFLPGSWSSSWTNPFPDAATLENKTATSRSIYMPLRPDGQSRTAHSYRQPHRRSRQSWRTRTHSSRQYHNCVLRNLGGRASYAEWFDTAGDCNLVGRESRPDFGFVREETMRSMLNTPFGVLLGTASPGSKATGHSDRASDRARRQDKATGQGWIGSCIEPGHRP